MKNGDMHGNGIKEGPAGAKGDADLEARKDLHKPVSAGAAAYGGLQQAHGDWAEAAFHFLTQASTFPNLLLPFVLASIGWGAGIPVFVAVTAVIVYCSYHISAINVIDGVRFNRYRDLAAHVWGEKTGKAILGTLNILLVAGAAIGSILSGGQLLKALVKLYVPDVAVTLTQFIYMVGGVVMVAGWIPTLHDIRWLNAFAGLLVLVYCIITGCLCIWAGATGVGTQDFTVIKGDQTTWAMTILNSVVLFGSVPVEPMIVETQATLANPVKDMFLGLHVGWPILIFEMVWVAIPEFTEPRGAVALALAMVVANICIMVNLYMQPLYELAERLIISQKCRTWHPRNFIPRIIVRSFWVMVWTTLAAMIPFFSSIQGFVSSITYLPMDVICPLLLYNGVKKDSINPLHKWFNYFLAILFSLFCIGGAIGSMRGIIVSANTFQLFANL